jgi:3-phosphoshikimate 1-carboxyvinyltransferase
MNKIKIIPGLKKESEIEIPGSKSYTNRSLIIASLIPGDIEIKNPLKSDDTDAMVDCLKSLGISIEEEGSVIKVKGDISGVQDAKFDLNAGLSGTTIRFLLALSCIIPGIKKIYGGESLNRRPIGELAGALKDLGADIEYLNTPGYPPLVVKSSNLTPGKTRLHGDISSQFFSALLMIAPVIGGLEIDVMGKQISKPYIDMTADLMSYFGAEMENHDYKKYIVGNRKYKRRDYTVEGDYSSAGYFAGIAVLNKAAVFLKNLNENSKQADKNFFTILKALGAELEFVSGGVKVFGNGVKPISVDMEDCPDQVQTLAVMLAFAKGKSVITGVRSLRVKETERVLAIQNELRKMGIKTESTHDTLTIYGGDPVAAEIDTYNDHRMAMAFAMAGTLLKGVVINNPEVVTKTFPGYWNCLRQAGAGIDEY